MPRLVMKFGGTSVATVERIRNVARHVKREVEAGIEVVVVASGEQVTSGLLAIVLQEMGLPARSWQGWQIPIHTSDAHGAARIAEIDGAGIQRGFRERREVAVVSGF